MIFQVTQILKFVGDPTLYISVLGPENEYHEFQRSQDDLTAPGYNWDPQTQVAMEARVAAAIVESGTAGSLAAMRAAIEGQFYHVPGLGVIGMSAPLGPPSPVTGKQPKNR